MQTIVLHSESDNDLKLLAKLAKKLGVKVKYISEEEREDMGLFNAIKKGRTGKYVNTQDFLNDLKK
jgi:hypothetical protein